MTESFLPIGVSAKEFYLMARIQESAIDFTFTYFSWWPSIACNLVSIATFHYSRSIFHGDVANSLGMTYVLYAIFNFIALLAMHLIMNKIGLLYSTTSFSTDESKTDWILENLQEGIVILDERTRKVVFFNKAMKDLSA